MAAREHPTPRHPPRYGRCAPQARRAIGSTAHRLIQEWRDAHGGEAAAPLGEGADLAAATNSTAANGAAAPVPSVNGGAAAAAAEEVSVDKTKPGGGAAPGSFLGLMLAARDRSCGRGLSDIEVREGLAVRSVGSATSLTGQGTVRHVYRRADRASGHACSPYRNS